MAAYLIDTNIALRFINAHSVQHQDVVHILDVIFQQGHDLYICPQNLIELWNVTTRPEDKNGFGWTCAESEAALQRLVRSFRLLNDNPTIFHEWRQLVNRYEVKGKQVHDARLVAIMVAYGIERLLTYNGDDFKRFPEVQAIHPRDIGRGNV